MDTGQHLAKIAAWLEESKARSAQPSRPAMS
jgi:hypothetical protein